MNIENLPVEILHLILMKLKGSEAAACRAVCRRWRNIIDSFSDRTWQNFCSQDFWEYQMIKHSNLSHQELYKSLALWDKIEEAELRTVEIPHDVASVAVLEFQVLYNNTLAIVTIENVDVDEDLWFHDGNTIQYYNSISLECISSERYPFTFTNYNENEYIIAMVARNLDLHITIKSNKHKIVYNLYDNNIHVTAYYSIISNSIYFVNRALNLCAARHKFVHGDEIIETETLGSWIHSINNIVAIAQTNQNAIKILTQELKGRNNYLNGLGIYKIQEKKFYLCCRVDAGNTARNIITKLKEFGFRWDAPVIYEYISINCYIPAALIYSKVYAHSELLLMSDSGQPDVHIFKSAFNENGELILNNEKANIIIQKMRSYKNGINEVEYRIPQHISELLVLEILNGHRIIVMDDYELFIFDLVHTQQKSTSTVGKKRHAARDEPSTSAKK